MTPRVFPLVDAVFSEKVLGLVQETDLTRDLLVATMCKTTSESS